MEEVGPKFAREHGLKSGYEWHGDQVMPQADRVDYMPRAEIGQGPRTAEEIAKALAEASPGSPSAAG
jgi:hypothetical protein